MSNAVRFSQGARYLRLTDKCPQCNSELYLDKMHADSDLIVCMFCNYRKECNKEREDNE